MARGYIIIEDVPDSGPSPVLVPTAPSTAPAVPAPPSATSINNSSTAPTSSATGGKAVALTAGRQLPTSAPATALRVLTADPANPTIGEYWYRSDTSQLCVRHDASTTKRVTLA